MFEKILVVEDFDVINSGIKIALEEINVKEVDYVSYCDEAFLKIKKAHLINKPYQLLISDLSFENDGTPQKLKSGDELIEKIRKEFSDLKIIVFSVEDKPFRIQNLYKNLNIQGYIWKNRNGLKELKKAIHKTFTSNEFCISPGLKSAVHPKETIEITSYDIHIIEQLSKGVLQDNLPKIFEEKQIKPSGKSSIEKRLKFLKEHFNANNPAHLVAIAKDFGLI
ncbi:MULTISPECIES: response regulator [Tenacibaculum]|uniref:response regulator n=1 Tax=Tenacibaculum TaxID=104267 RepID=UPI001F0B1C15|nr:MULTISPECIES: response regulator [Tenacibaculum]MCH3883263.1 response regulator [Tenacibaculum aquimarinum]MDO6600381.1 response regulator [Tenacibaculum sp. 1_MG-2023]